MIKPIRRMIYSNDNNNGEILYLDSYKGYNYLVLSYGTHPCCYIMLDTNSKYYGKSYLQIPLDVHGGLTYSGDSLGNFLNRENYWIIGWDYAHCGDRYGGYLINGHTWKTTELIRDCIKAIDKLEVM